MKKYLFIIFLVGIVYNQNDISIEHLIFKEGKLFLMIMVITLLLVAVSMKIIKMEVECIRVDIKMV